MSSSSGLQHHRANLICNRLAISLYGKPIEAFYDVQLRYKVFDLPFRYSWEERMSMDNGNVSSFFIPDFLDEVMDT